MLGGIINEVEPVKAGNTALSGDPIESGAVLHNARNVGLRKAILNAVIGEVVRLGF
jgi:hypothetical protein